MHAVLTAINNQLVQDNFENTSELSVQTFCVYFSFCVVDYFQIVIPFRCLFIVE